jgi:hypothetical protein
MLQHCVPLIPLRGRSRDFLECVTVLTTDSLSMTAFLEIGARLNGDSKYKHSVYSFPQIIRSTAAKKQRKTTHLAKFGALIHSATVILLRTFLKQNLSYHFAPFLINY